MDDNTINPNNDGWKDLNSSAPKTETNTWGSPTPLADNSDSPWQSGLFTPGDETTPAQDNIPPVTPPFPPVTDVKPKSKFPVWAIVLIVVAVLLLCCCCIGVIVFAVLQSKGGFGLSLLQTLLLV